MTSCLPNVTADTYTIEVDDAVVQDAQADRRRGRAPGRASRSGILTIDVGGASRDGRRSRARRRSSRRRAASARSPFPPNRSQNLPIANRSFIGAGVAGAWRDRHEPLGTAADMANQHHDGRRLDDGHRQQRGRCCSMNVESIAEVKVLASVYQAEYGRSSGLQITAVTKSGTNQFRGSVYDVERNSDWNANSKTNILNGDPEDGARRKRTGATRSAVRSASPAATTSCSSSTARSSRRAPAATTSQRFRLPTALERAGDFSQTTDNNGSPYPYIKDPLLSRRLHARRIQTGCFTDGGVLGRIPAEPRSTRPGLNILKHVAAAERQRRPAGQAYNYEITRPAEEQRCSTSRRSASTTSRCRSCGRPSSTRAGSQRQQVDPRAAARVQRHAACSSPVISTLSGRRSTTTSATTMFLEGTYGRSRNELAGCALAQSGTGPTFCRARSDESDRSKTTPASAVLPFLFPNANVLNPDYYAYEALNGMKPRRPGTGQRRLREAAELSRGAAGSAQRRRPNMSVPRLPQRQRDARTSRSA